MIKSPLETKVSTAEDRLKEISESDEYHIGMIKILNRNLVDTNVSSIKQVNFFLDVFDAQVSELIKNNGKPGYYCCKLHIQKREILVSYQRKL